MSLTSQRVKFIRERILEDAIFGDIESPKHFGILYDFLDFIHPGNGNLQAHPKTKEDPQIYMEENPPAAAAYLKAVSRWVDFREKVRAEYKKK